MHQLIPYVLLLIGLGALVWTGVIAGFDRLLRLLPLLLLGSLVFWRVGPLSFSFLELTVWTGALGYMLTHGLQKSWWCDAWALWKGDRWWRSPLLYFGAFFVLATLSLFVVPKEMIFQTGLIDFPEEVFATRTIALGIWKGWVIPMVLLGLLYPLVLQRKHERKEALYALVGGVLVLLVLGLFWRFGLGWQDTLDGRFGGVFVSANYLAFLLVPALLLAASWWWNQKSLWKGVLVGVLLLGVLLARSYASWAILLVLAFLWLWRQLSSWKFRAALVFVGLLVVGGIVGRELMTEKGQAFVTVEERSSTSVRLQVYEISSVLALEKPLLGYGMGQYEALYKTQAHRILGDPPYEWVMLHPHNTLLSMIVAFGILGGLWYLWGIGLFIARYREISGAVVLVFVYLHLHGLVDTLFWKLDLMVLWALFSAFLFLPALPKGQDSLQ